jgi:hypothetical protein
MTNRHENITQIYGAYYKPNQQNSSDKPTGEIYWGLPSLRRQEKAQQPEGQWIIY